LFQLLEALKEDNIEIDLQYLNPSDPTSLQQLMTYVAGLYRKVDLLVNHSENSPAIPADASPMYDTLGTLSQVLGSNTVGPYLLIQAVIPLMRQNGFGRIINVTDTASTNHTETECISYAISKAGINIMTKIIADWFQQNTARGHTKDANIKINAVNPGFVRTRPYHTTLPENFPEKFGMEWKSPEEAAGDIMFLANPDPNFANGKLFYEKKQIPW